MKRLIVVSLMLGLVGTVLGDIQDPPANDYGPTRKLGRGLSNFLCAPAEIFVTITQSTITTAITLRRVWCGPWRRALWHAAYRRLD